MKPMFVTHINFAKGFRGGERQTLNLIEGLAALNVMQALVCHPRSELHERARLLKVATLDVKNPVLGHLHVPASSINHVHEARGAYWAAIEHALRGTPYLITRRIPNPVSGSAFNNFAYRRAARLVGVSQDVARLLARQTGRGVHAILDSSSVEAPDARAVDGIRHQLGRGPIIGHVGALHDHHKGQSTLIAAFHELVSSYPDARLVLLGEGPDKERFQALARNDARIVFAGFQENVATWIAAMDVFAFPSREEGLGSSVLDAMSLGVPVVSSNVGGLPELVGAGRGLMLGTDDPLLWSASIKDLLDNAQLTAQLRNAASEFAASRNIAAMTKDYVEVYKSISAEEEGAALPAGTRRKPQAVEHEV